MAITTTAAAAKPKTTSNPATVRKVAPKESVRAAKIRAARVAIDAWEVAVIECDSEKANRTVAASNAALTVRCFAFEKAIKTIRAAARADGHSGGVGSVSHRGKFYAVVSTDHVTGMGEDSKGRMTIVVIDQDSIVKD